MAAPTPTPTTRPAVTLLCEWRVEGCLSRARVLVSRPTPTRTSRPAAPSLAPPPPPWVGRVSFFQSRVFASSCPPNPCSLPAPPWQLHQHARRRTGSSLLGARAAENGVGSFEKMGAQRRKLAAALDEGAYKNFPFSTPRREHASLNAPSGALPHTSRFSSAAFSAELNAAAPDGGRPAARGVRDAAAGLAGGECVWGVFGEGGTGTSAVSTCLHTLAALGSPSGGRTGGPRAFSGANVAPPVYHCASRPPHPTHAPPAVLAGRRGLLGSCVGGRYDEGGTFGGCQGWGGGLPQTPACGARPFFRATRHALSSAALYKP